MATFPLPGPVQAVIDSQAGVVIANVLHTAGAIAWLGGLVAFFIWYRAILSGTHRSRWLDAAALWTYVAIAFNFVGGFMRTFQSGHPGLQEFGSSAWVQVLTIKHVALFAAAGASIYLLESVAPRLLRARKGGPAPGRRGVEAASAIVVASILIASVLGAVSTVVPLGTASPDGGHDGVVEGNTTVAQGVVYHNFSGQLTSTPVMQAEVAGSFSVPADIAVLDATLEWDNARFDLALELEKQDGNGSASGASEGDRAEARVELPAPGGWMYRITSDAAIQVQWTLTIRLTPAAGDEMVLTRTVTIAGGTFYEINTEMPENNTIRWEWSTDATAAFNVHTHFDDEVQYLMYFEATEDKGQVTADRTGGYSLMWENNGTLPMQLTYRVWGGYTLDSIFP